MHRPAKNSPLFIMVLFFSHPRFASQWKPSRKEQPFSRLPSTAHQTPQKAALTDKPWNYSTSRRQQNQT